MAWFTSRDNAINQLELSPSWLLQIISGNDNVINYMVKKISDDVTRLKRTVFVALDGFKGIDLPKFAEVLGEGLRKLGTPVFLYNVNAAFLTQDQIQKKIDPYTQPEDPDFGRVFDGQLEEFLEEDGVRIFAQAWRNLRNSKERSGVVICYGMGAATVAWGFAFDRVAYFDLTREEYIKRAEKNQVSSLGTDSKEGFSWRRLYYVEYPLLNRHKKKVLANLDWYVDSVQENELKLVPAAVYRGMMVELSGLPICLKVFYMPGTFGGTEFGKRFKVDGLPNTSWDYEISVGDNHLLIDPGDGRVLEIPLYNLLWEQPLRFVGSYSHETYPDHFPIAVYMQDGFFEPTDNSGFKRTYMPHHLHPDTAYCRKHFNEPLGRYETYYIVRADQGAVTMHGFKEGADVGEYVAEVERSAATGVEFDWRKYISEHPSRTGELQQLPPGTVHGTGGRQIILEIDTNPSRESTEYSFYLYDYCRRNFNYAKNNFDGETARLQISHGLSVMRKSRREKFMAKYCRPDPVCIRKGDDWREMSFPMYFTMPYQVNRLEFSTSIEDDTNGMFQCLALTQGDSVEVKSTIHPGNSFVMGDCDNIIVPASFGKYVCRNLSTAPCQIIKTFLITEPRDHIDQEEEEKIINSREAIS